VLVAAGAARRIEVFRSSGALLGSFGDAGFRGLAVTPTGDVYATAGNLVQQWRPPIPTTAILAPRPRQWTNTLHPRLLVASDQPGTKLCTILGPTFAHGAETGRCGVLLAHPHLAPDTTYLLRAQATNRQGYSSRSIPQVEFTVDTDTPLTRIEKVSGPSREQGGGIVYTTSTPTLYFSSQESQFARRYESYAFPFGAPIYAEQPPPVLYAYTCQVDSRAPVRCQSPFTPPPLANGRHTITIRAADQAGNRYKLAYGVNVGAPPPACRGIYCIPPPPGH
jgi:hypothetical protein